MGTLFSPDTLKEKFHHAYSWAVKRGAYDKPTRELLDNMRANNPQVYMSLAVMAHNGKWQHGNSDSFRYGVRIFIACQND